MTTPDPHGRSLFVTVPVADVAASTAFFRALGFEQDPAFSGETSACVVVNGQARIMLGSYPTFAEHSHRPAADPATHALALFSFTVASREEVDTVAAAALAAGGVEADGLEDHGFMCSRSFVDLDGHGWQVMWFDPAQAGDGPG